MKLVQLLASPWCPGPEPATCALQAGTIRRVIRLPDVLLSRDEDVLWLHNGTELHVILLGTPNPSHQSSEGTSAHNWLSRDARPTHVSEY